MPLKSRAMLALLMTLSMSAATVALAQPRSGDKRFTFTDSLPSFVPAPGHGLVCLVREQQVRAVLMKPERLYLDGAPLGFLAQTSYLLLDVMPGLHRIESVGGPPPVVLSVAAGELRLLRLREVIDPFDVTLMHWILDAPDAARELVTATPLARSRVTEAGLKDLERKTANLDTVTPPDSIVTPDDDRQIVRVSNIWFEHPLDHLNLRRDFSIYSGALELRPDTIVYDMQKKRRDVHVEIPYDRIERVRYGGTRAVGLNPWIDIFYRGEGDTTWRASFADAGTQNPEASYNRLFGLIRARSVGRTWAADSAAQAPGDGASRP